MLLYVANPDIAAFMPAYTAALPDGVYTCLVDHPRGCWYAEMAPYLTEQTLESGGGSRNKTPRLGDGAASRAGPRVTGTDDLYAGSSPR